MSITLDFGFPWTFQKTHTCPLFAYCLFYIWILAHPVCTMWIIQEPKKVALRNKQHFEQKNGECAACLKYSVLIFVEKNI